MWIIIHAACITNYPFRCSDSTTGGGWKEKREGKITWRGGGVVGGLARRLTWGWWREQRKERERKMAWKLWGGERLVFFFKFCTYFLLTQVMKSTHTYKRWKKGRFVSISAKSWPLTRHKTSQPLAQSSYHELSDLLQEKGWSGWPLRGGAITTMVSTSQNNHTGV
jgi:hypothetical protein